MSEGGQPSVAGPRATGPVRASDAVYAGLTLIAAAVVCFVASLLVLRHVSAAIWLVVSSGNLSLLAWGPDTVGPVIVWAFIVFAGFVGYTLTTGRFSVERHDLYGGVVIVVAVTILLVISLGVRNRDLLGPTLTPRVFSLIVGFAALSLLTGSLPVRAPQDFFGGVALVGLAIIAMLASNELPGQRGFAFGPGTAPRLFATLLATLGCVIALIGSFVQGPPLERYKVRGVIFIIGSILIFAACIRPLGLVIAAFSCIVTCAAADPEVRWRETVAWAIILTAFCSFLFPYGLNLPFQLWPRQWL